MNEFVKNLKDHTLMNYGKIFDILDNVLNCTVESFQDIEVIYDGSKDHFKVDKLYNSEDSLIIAIDHGIEPVIRIIVNSSDKTLADCVMGVNGEFAEHYTRFTCPELKSKVSSYFTELSLISVADSTDSEASEDFKSTEDIPEVDVAEDIEDINTVEIVGDVE